MQVEIIDVKPTVPAVIGGLYEKDGKQYRLYDNGDGFVRLLEADTWKATGYGATPKAMSRNLAEGGFVLIEGAEGTGGAKTTEEVPFVPGGVYEYVDEPFTSGGEYRILVMTNDEEPRMFAPDGEQCNMWSSVDEARAEIGKLYRYVDGARLVIPRGKSS